jgi:hypothetical protein
MQCRKKGSAPSGCEWTGPLSDRESHLNECPLSWVQCKWGCAKFQLHHLAEHEAECLDRVMQCEHCNDGIIFREMKRHLQQCAMAPTECPNGCGVRTRKSLLPQHDAQCPRKVVDCPFACHGCGRRAMRMDMPTHVEAAVGAHALLLSSSLQSSAEKTKADLAAKDDVITKLETSIAERDTALQAVMKRLAALEAASKKQDLTAEVLADNLDSAKAELREAMDETTATVEEKLEVLDESIENLQVDGLGLKKAAEQTTATVTWVVKNARRCVRSGVVIVAPPTPLPLALFVMILIPIRSFLLRQCNDFAACGRAVSRTHVYVCKCALYLCLSSLTRWCMSAQHATQHAVR